MVVERESKQRSAWLPLCLLLGLLIGGAVAWFLATGRAGPRGEVPWEKPWAPADDVATWTVDWERRAAKWAQDLPDPPGQGEVVRARYWLGHLSYDMEVRRRGDRFVVAVSGIDEQVGGGGWSAFGEGRIEGPGNRFAGMVATFRWSCLSTRYRTASDGVGRIRFTPSGDGLAAVYLAHESPMLWWKSYGERHDGTGPRPERGTIRGQIPFSSLLKKLEPGRCRIRVKVVDAAGAPLQGAVVQLRGRRRTRRVTGHDGTAIVTFLAEHAPHAQTFAAGLPDYYCSETTHFTGDLRYARAEGDALPEATIRMDGADLTDHPTYAWNHAGRDHDPDDMMACATCHNTYYQQWIGSRHARMADNGLVQGVYEAMRKHAPEAPDDCVGCHQPGHAAQSADRRLRPRGMTAGNHCDLCHKIHRMGKLEESGVLGSIRLARPAAGAGHARPGGIGHVFGSAPDATYAYMGAIYNPLFTASHLCAGCHQGGGRWREGLPPKVDTYQEWVRWSEAEQAAGREARSCQSCHMPAGGMTLTTGKAADQYAYDAAHRTPQDVHGHDFPGRSPAFAADALEVKIEKARSEDGKAWIVTVSLENVGAGHKIPTGTWTKHVAVGVWAQSGKAWLGPAEDSERALLVPAAEAAAVGAPMRPGDWRNPAGTVLGMAVKGGGSLPHARPAFYAPWKPADLVDRRLAPREVRRVETRFAVGDSTEVPEVTVWVVHRRSDLGRGMAHANVPIRPYDAPPEVVWKRITR